MMKPRTGDEMSGTSTLPTKPDHFTAPVPAAAIVAPRSAPIRAWLLELGMPRRQVRRFQAIAPRSAATTIVCDVVASLTRPAPIVFATAVPANAPMKLKAAAIRIACWGRSARVATEVAIAFAVSWKPLM